MFTPIKSDNLGEDSERSKVPGSVPHAASVTREGLLLSAASRDIMTANNTKEQHDFFMRMKVENAIIIKRFYERHKAGGVPSEDVAVVQEVTEENQVPPVIFLDDDDD
jgi:hypothetical protein